MHSIAIMNQKGGVGKTTTAVNVSAALAATGQRVCLIDLDPQAHASLHFGIEPRLDGPSIYDVLVRDVPLAEVRRQVDTNLWVVGSHLDLAAAEVELAGVVGREVILRDKFEEDDAEFDYLFVDCPPSLGILTLNALAAVEEVFIPLQPHFLALHGLSKLLETIELVARRLNNKLKLGGVVMCMFDAGTRLAAEVSEDVEEFFRRAQSQGIALGASPHVPDADPAQRTSGRGSELRAIDSPVRAHVQRRRRLPCVGRRDPCARPGAGLSPQCGRADSAAGIGGRERRSDGFRPPLAC